MWHRGKKNRNPARPRTLGVLLILRNSSINYINLCWSEWKIRGSRKGTSDLVLFKYGKTIKWSLTWLVQFMIALQLTFVVVVETGFLFSPNRHWPGTLCRVGWPWSRRDSPASVSGVLGLNVCHCTQQQLFTSFVYVCVCVCACVIFYAHVLRWL